MSADDTDLILQSDQSVARVNSRLAWSFEWAWMIYAVSVGYRVTTLQHYSASVPPGTHGTSTKPVRAVPVLIGTHGTGTGTDAMGRTRQSDRSGQPDRSRTTPSHRSEARGARQGATQPDGKQGQSALGISVGATAVLHVLAARPRVQIVHREADQAARREGCWRVHVIALIQSAPKLFDHAVAVASRIDGL